MSLENVDESWFGTAKKVTLTKEHTTIVEGGGDEDTVEHD